MRLLGRDSIFVKSLRGFGYVIATASKHHLVLEMFQTGKSPLDVAVTVEIVGFIEAAYRSAGNHGAGEKVEGL